MGKAKRKKWVGLFAVIIGLLGICPVTAKAQERRIFDDAALLTLDEAKELGSEIGELRTKTGQDVVVVTTDDAKGKSAMEYADDFYDQNGFGTGTEKNGVLLLLDMDNREIWISKSGEMIDILTDARTETMLDNVYEEMSDGDYASAVEAFLEDTEYYIEQGVPVGQYREVVNNIKSLSRPQRGLIGLLAGFALGAAVSGISCLVIVLRYKGGRGKGEYAYQQEGKMLLSKKNDVFLNKHVTHRTIPKNPPSQGGSSGRSSVHTSSSGNLHGGGGRKF